MSDLLERLDDPFEFVDGMTVVPSMEFDRMICLREEAKAEIERLTAEVASKHEWCVNADLRIAELEAAMQEFCDRRDRGEIVSTYTYAKFKDALEAK